MSISGDPVRRPDGMSSRMSSRILSRACRRRAAAIRRCRARIHLRGALALSARRALEHGACALVPQAPWRRRSGAHARRASRAGAVTARYLRTSSTWRAGAARAQATRRASPRPRPERTSRQPAAAALAMSRGRCRAVAVARSIVAADVVADVAADIVLLLPPTACAPSMSRGRCRSSALAHLAHAGAQSRPTVLNSPTLDVATRDAQLVTDPRLATRTRSAASSLVMAELLARFVSAFKRGIEGELAAMRASAEAFEIPLTRGEDLGALRYASSCGARSGSSPGTACSLRGGARRAARDDRARRRTSGS